MRQWTVDAFAAQPFRGNPACVVEPFEAWPDDAWMQALASENNQAETAFLLKTDDPARFGLRWFTPLLEVPLCGHATLASGHALLAEMGVAAEVLTFDTRSGPLTVRRASTTPTLFNPSHSFRSANHSSFSVCQYRRTSIRPCSLSVVSVVTKCVSFRAMASSRKVFTSV